jgi:hypothetical protein
MAELLQIAGTGSPLPPGATKLRSVPEGEGVLATTLLFDCPRPSHDALTLTLSRRERGPL